MKKKLTLGSLFDGIGGWQLAAEEAGIQPIWSSEIEKFPCALTKERFPKTVQLGDVTKIKEDDIAPVDIVCAGSPCFHEDTMILTQKGQVPIKNVQAGDFVIGSDGKWHKVTERMVTPSSDIYKVKIQGTIDTIVTGNHPYLIRKNIKKLHLDDDGNLLYSQFSEPVWVQAKELETGDYVGVPILAVSENSLHITEEEAWILGRYLQTGKLLSDGRVIISLNLKQISSIEKEREGRLKEIGRIGINHCTVYYEVSDEVREKLLPVFEVCGKTRDEKTIPKEILDLPLNLLEKFFQGFLGNRLPTRRERTKEFCITVTRLPMALGLQTLLTKLYQAPCRVALNSQNKQERYIIMWRNQEEAKKGKKKAAIIDGYIWQSFIKKEKLDMSRDMYNLEVEDVHSYLANGVIVHNCQDLSVAGRREGLKGAKSGLFYRAVDIVRNMRKRTGGEFPKFFVWENVKGSFSSNRGFDFKSVLEEISETKIPMPANGKWAEAGMAKLPKCDIAWRVLDAQYWGVPQRRERVFLVADFRARGERAAELLFVPESVQGDSSKSNNTKEKASRRTSKSFGTAVKTHGFNINASIKDNNPVLEECAPPLKTTNHIGVHASQTCYNICAYASNSMKSDNPHSGIYRTNKTRTLDLNGGNPACNQGGTMILVAGFKPGASAMAGSVAYHIEKAPTLASMESGNKVAVAIYDIQHRADVIRKVGKICPTLTARMGTGGHNVPIVHSLSLQGSMIGRKEKNGPRGSGILDEQCFTLNTVDRHAVCKTEKGTVFGKTSFAAYEATKITPSLRASGGDLGGGSEMIYMESAVRRLTPLECERLQGLPDNFTLIDDKSCSDSARYKALGNGMAHPCAKYVMEQVTRMVEERYAF